MLNVFRGWIEKYFSNEEALLLMLIAPMVAGVIIAFLLQGMVDRMKSWGLPHIAAVAIAFAFLVSILATFIVVVLPILWQQLMKLVAELPNMIHRVQDALYLLPEQYPNVVTAQQIHDAIDLSTEQVSDIVHKVLSVSLAGFPVVGHILVYLILVPILVFLFLKDSRVILNWLASFLPKKRPMMRRVWKEMNQQAANYVRGKFIQIIIVIAACYIIFASLGLHYATLLAIVVGISVLIPYVGTAAASVPVVVVGFFQWGWSPDFIYLCISFSVMHAIDGNILVPLIFSEAVNLHPVAIILAVLVFGGIWGFWGVFFAIPLATLVKAIIYAWPKAKLADAESM
jgi:putative permease